MDIVHSANSNSGDYQNRFFVTAGTMKGQGILTCNNATGNAQVTSMVANSSTNTGLTIIGTQVSDIDFISSMKIIFAFTASANATFKYQFSPAVLNVSWTARTWKGSILKYKKIN